MACQALKKHTGLPSETRSTPREVRGEPGRPDPVRRSVASITAGNFFATSGFILS